MDKHPKHLDALHHNDGGGLIVGCSNLSRSIWNGELLYFDHCLGDITLNQCQASDTLDCGVTDVKWISGTRRLVAACDSGAVELWELSEEKDCLNCVARPIEHDSIVSCLSVNSSATKFVSASYDHSIRIWDIEEFKPVSMFTGHYDIVWSVAYHSSNPDILASCSRDGRMMVWDFRQQKPASVMESEFLPSLPTCVTWQPTTENSVAIGTESGHILLQDSRVGVGTPSIVSAHSRLVYRLTFSPRCNDWLASASNDCTSAVSEFSESASSVLYQNTCQKDFIQGLSWNPVSQQLYSCSWDGTLLGRDIATESNCDNIADN